MNSKQLLLTVEQRLIAATWPEGDDPYTSHGGSNGCYKLEVRFRKAAESFQLSPELQRIRITRDSQIIGRPDAQDYDSQIAFIQAALGKP